MRIIVKSKERNIRLRLPAAMLFNGFTARICGAAVSKRSGVPGLSGAQIRALILEIRRCRKKYGSWTLAEVESADGEKIFVKI